MRNSLFLKLLGAFLLVIAIAALVIYFLTTQATQNAFRLYTTQNSQLWAQRLAPDYADYYARLGSWQGVDVFMQSDLLSTGMMGMMNGQRRGQGQANGANGSGMMAGMAQRLILADSQGRVIEDTYQELSGKVLSADEIASGAPIIVDEQLVGTLIVAPGDQRVGENPSSIFLSTVNRSIIISVLVASAIGLLLVSFFFFQITAPLRQIEKAAAAISKGDLEQRVVVRSKDELGELAKTFNHMADSLQNAEAQRQKLIADVAHELRTPLAVIQANTEGMVDGVLPVDLEQVNAIHAETLLLGRLINDLRLISLAEAGELRLERRLTNLGELIQAVKEKFYPQCLLKGIVLELSLDDGLPKVSVDADRITQVLNNLVGNALRYTPQGGAITLHAGNGSNSVNEVDISVTDTGSGIAAEDLPLVFDRFYRVDRSRTRASGGSGLGLAIAKQLIEAHGGTVRAISPVYGEPGQGYGTRITFSLPWAKPAA